MMTRRMRVVVSIGGLLVMVGAFWWMRGRSGPEGEDGAPAGVRARGMVTAARARSGVARERFGGRAGASERAQAAV